MSGNTTFHGSEFALLPIALAFIISSIQAIPFLLYRWSTDESWLAETRYSKAKGQGIEKPSFGPDYLVSKFDAHPQRMALAIAALHQPLRATEVLVRLGSVITCATTSLLVCLLGLRSIGLRCASLTASTFRMPPLECRQIAYERTFPPRPVDEYCPQNIVAGGRQLTASSANAVGFYGRSLRELADIISLRTLVAAIPNSYCDELREYGLGRHCVCTVT